MPTYLFLCALVCVGHLLLHGLQRALLLGKVGTQLRQVTRPVFWGGVLGCKCVCVCFGVCFGLCMVFKCKWCVGVIG